MYVSNLRGKSLSIFMALGLFCFAPSVDLVVAQRQGIPAPKETSLPDGEVELTMSRFHRLPLVELMINDTGPYRMIVDTGASGVVLQPELAKKLDLPSPPGMPPNMQVQVKTPGGGVPATLHYIDKLELAEARFGGVWAIGTTLPFGDGMDGVIGMNIFRECLLTYDFPGSRVVLSKGALPKANGKDILPYETPRMADSHPFVELKIDGKPRSTFIDSGMSGWFAVPRDTSDDFTFLKGPIDARMGQSVGNERSHNMAGRVDASFEVGHFAVEDPVVLLGAETMIGTLFLENFVVTFDARNKRVQLVRHSDEPLTRPAMRSLGFVLKRMGEDMLVTYVHPKSDASAQGLEVDDVVLEIGGKPVGDTYDSAGLNELIQNEVSVAVSYEPGDGDQVKEMEMDILELLQ